MADGIAVVFGLGAILIMLASVLGSVERRERFAFVLGVVLILVGLFLPASNALRAVAVLFVLGGFVAIVASVVPLLRE